MTERRYDEAEVAAIFEQASMAEPVGQRRLPPAEGMTLAEIQDIGREVGISPELIGQAAQVVAARNLPGPRRVLGLPIGVERTIDLGRRLSDAEWERLVVDLRETFDARGVLKQEGSFRQWTNGNLQALLEPTPTGERLRLRTVKGDAPGLILGGAVFSGAATLGLIAAALRGALGDLGMVAALGGLAAMGLAMIGVNLLRLPRWARLRQRQMDEIAGRLSGPAAQLVPPRDSTV